MIKVGIAGAAGKMGTALVRAVAEDPNLTLTCAWERSGHPSLGQDAGTLAGIAAGGVKIAETGNLRDAGCEVLLDFTSAEATMNRLRQIQAGGPALVIGTTGLDAGQQAQLRAAASRSAIIYATNFSVGVNLLGVLAREAARALGRAFDVEIIEAHHNQKKDAPSGTALTLLEEICQGLSLDPQTAARYGRHGQTGARTRGEIGVHAVRGGDIIGDHTVLFAGPGERLELKHQAHSRDTLARGAIRAAGWLAGRPAGWYSMAQVLGLAK